MSYSDLIGQVNQNGFWQGLQNYVGNNTSFGQDVNAADNIYQALTGTPKSQLVGQPASQTNTSMGSSSYGINDSHLGDKDKNGIRPFNNDGMAYIQSQGFLKPTQSDQSNNDVQPVNPLGNTSSGTGGKALAAFALL